MVASRDLYKTQGKDLLQILAKKFNSVAGRNIRRDVNDQ